MVSLDLPDDDRGQLLLVGATAIALVIIGSIVLLNGLKFTDTVGTEGNFDATDEAQRTAEMVRRDLSELTERVRNRTTLATFDTAIRRNVTVYSNRLTNLTFSDSATYVNVSLNDDAWRSGIRVRKTDPSTRFGHPNGLSDFGDPVPVAENASLVGSFIVTIRDFSCSGTTAEFTVTVEDHATGTDHWSMEVTCRSDPTSNTRLVRIRDSPTGSPVLELEGGDELATTGDVHIDLQRGEVGGRRWDELAFESVVDGPYDITVENDGPPGQGLEGTYVVGSDTDGGLSWTGGSPPEPTQTAISKYRPAFSFVYERPGITYNTTIVEGST